MTVLLDSEILSPLSNMGVADAGFFRLPLEIRQNIYRQHLLMSYRPTPWMVYRHTHADRSPRGKPFPGVNKQFHEELLDVLKHEREFCYRIDSQDARFDLLALTCFRVLKRRISFSEIRHLVVDIYPPHPDRPIDMYHIWKGVDSLCNDLRNASVIPSLSIQFVEDEIAKWSTNGKPNETMGVMLWDKQTTNCDVGFILDVFARLTNVTKSTISLPTSLTDHEDLQAFAQGTRDSMTNLHPFTREMVDLHYGLLSDDIDSSKWVMEAATGRKSLAKLTAFYGDDARLTWDTFDQFQDLWPHMDALGKHEYEGCGKFLDWTRYFHTDNEGEAEAKHGKPSWK